MELKELIGLHVLQRVEIVEETPDIKIAHFSLDYYRYTVSEYRLPNGTTRMDGPHVSGVESSADGSGMLVFCLHRDSSFSGHSCEDADILEIYNANTARKVLTIGTKDICRNSRCIIEGDPIRIVGIPGRTTRPTAWGGAVEIPGGEGCVFRFGDDPQKDGDNHAKIQR